MISLHASGCWLLRLGILVTALGLGWAAEAPREVMSPVLWREQMLALAHALEVVDQPQITEIGERLRAAEVTWPEGRRPADVGMVALATGGDRAEARARCLALAAYAAERAPAPGQQPRVDQQRLSALDQERRTATLAAGGEIGSVPEVTLPDVPFLKRIGNALRGWFSDLWTWIGSWFDQERKPGDHGSQGSHWAWVAAGAVIVLLVAILLVSSRRTTQGESLANTEPLPPGEDEALDRSASAWMDEGDRRLRAGDHRGAVRAWYLALLAGTWERGIAHHRTGWTNWEYVRALPAGWMGSPVFRRLTGDFDRIWYGGQGDAAMASDFRDQAADLMRLISERAGA